jgi:acetyl-CoA carboxylase carboxyltransferase component
VRRPVRSPGRGGPFIGAEGDARTGTAARAGEIEAEVADLRLRLKESQEREKRLVERVFTAEELLDDALSTEHDLRTQIHRYSEFNRAVEKSRPWRMIQFLRRLVGREW